VSKLGIEQLERRYILQILLFLYDREKAIYSEIVNNIPGSEPTKHKALRQLVDMQLLKEERKHPRRYLTLTPKGKKIAEKLKEIQKILET